MVEKKFKLRHGIRQVEIQRESLSGVAITAAKFINKFEGTISVEGFFKEYTYNADYMGINLRSLPRKSYASSVK